MKYHAKKKVTIEKKPSVRYIMIYAFKLIEEKILNTSATKKLAIQFELAAIEFAVPIT